jgi:hypothetical protein
MATIQIATGPQVLGDGASVTARAGRTGELDVADTHGRYQEATYRGNVFLASNQAAQSLSTALSATQTGFTLTNPAGSGKLLVVLDACIALASAPAGISTLVWAANVNTVAAAVTQTTPLTVRSANLGFAGTAVGLAASAVTLPAAPVVVRPVSGGPVATGSVTSAFIRDEIAGSLILQPGTALSLSALTTAISVICGLVWEEILL